MALPSISDISKARTNARQFGDGTAYALDFNVNGQNYTFVPSNVVKNGGVSNDANTYFLPWFVNADNQKEFGKTASSFDLSSNTGLADYLKSQGQSSNGYLIPSDKVSFDGSVSTIPTATLGGGLSGLKQNGDQIVAGLSGGHGGAYLDPTSGEVHDPYTEYHSMLGDVFGSAGEDLSSAVNDVLSSPAGQIALAYFLPGVGAELGSSLFASQIAAGTITAVQATAVGTAIASTAVQVANGVDFDTALKNATVNAVVSTGSPTVANDIAKAVGSTGVADAITSSGASIASTLAKGGNMNEALSNAGAAIAASGASQASDSRAVGAAVGGGITGGATGAALGAAGEAGRPTPTAPGVKVASAGDLISEPGVISDTPTDVGLTEIVAPKEPGIGATDVQILDTIRNQQNKVAAPTGKTTPLPDVTVTAPKESANIAATDIQTVSDIPTVEVVGKKETIPTITVTAPKEPSITDTDIQVEDPITDAPEETGPRATDIFVYGGSKSPSTLGKSLGTTFQAPFYPTAGTTSSLTAERGAGEIEGVESGKKRKDVWNEESLRLKDALGL